MVLTLTDALRGWLDEALVRLLRARPDLAVPAPADLGALAARAQSRISVARMVDQLNRFQLEILDALRLTRGPDGLTSLAEVLAITATRRGSGADPAAVRAAVGHLGEHLLVYGPPDALQVVATVDDVLGPYPAGLGRRAAELDATAGELVADPAQLRCSLLAAPPPARAVLDRLAAGPPVGAQTQSGDGSPVGWLVSRGLLVTTSPTTVELPREVGTLLRRNTGPLGQLHPAPPAPDGDPLDPGAVDAAGAGQALEAVQRTEALLEALAAEPAPVLRAGGFGIRELRRLARAAGVTEPVAGLLVESAAAAGLLSEADTADFRPTVGYDSWRAAPVAARWQVLASRWLALARQPGLVGERDARDRVTGPLSPETCRTGLPAVRRAVLAALAGLAPGTAPTPDEVLHLVGWAAPRRCAGQGTVVRQLLDEAAALGVTARGGLTSFGAALLGEDGTAPEDDPLGIRAGDTAGAGLSPAAALLDPLLPPPVAEVLVQADLTVVVPGPPEPSLAAELATVADAESAGGGSVYRVTRESVRRALDAGYPVEAVHALFAQRSRTPVPQALTYLIDDVARTHGGLRVGSAGAYLRSDDPTLVTQVFADRRLAALRWRRLAPTVLATGAPGGRVLAALREAGYAPVPEDADGAAVLVRPRTRRAPARPAAVAPADPFTGSRMSTPRLLGIVEDIRRGDAAARAARRAPATVRPNGTPTAGGAAAQAHAEAMAVLQQAVRDKALVWIGYVDSQGGRTSRLLRPVSIGAGYLRAEDDRTDTLHTFALHRITAASREE